MDSGWAVVLGSGIGVVGSLATTLVTKWLNQKKPGPSEMAAKGLLVNMLSRKEFNWTSVQTLANVIGTDESTVRRLLLEIGARGSMRDGKLWGLVSRNPITEEDRLDDPVKKSVSPEPSK